MLSLNLQNKRFSSAMLFFVYVLAVTIGMLKGGAWAAITIGGGLATMLCVWCETRKFPMPDKAAFSFVGAFLGMAACQALFSPYQDLALYSVFKLGTIFLPLLFFTAPLISERGQVLVEKKTLLFTFMILGFVMLAAALVLSITYVGFESVSMTKLNRGLSHGLLLAVPLVGAAFAQQKRQGFLFLVIILILLALTHSRTTQAASVAALVVFVIARFWPVLTTRLMGVGMTLSLGWPYYARYAFEYIRQFISDLPPTLAARVEIWDYMAYRIAEKPLFGWGIGVSHKLDWEQPNGDFYKVTVEPAAHPHNAIVQLWGEMGLPGLIFAILLGFWLFGGIKKLSAHYVPYALAALAMAFVLLMAAYNLWTDSLWSAFALTIFAFVSFGRKKIKASLSP